MNQDKVLLLEGFQNDNLIYASHLHTNILKKLNAILIPLFEKGWTILYAVRFDIANHNSNKQQKKECILGTYGAHLCSSLFVPSIQADKHRQCFYVPFALDFSERSNNIFYHSSSNKDPTLLKSILAEKQCTRLVLCGLHQSILVETSQIAKNDLNIENVQCVPISNESDLLLLETLTNL